MNALFFLTNALTGLGLAMDAFSVSLANGLSDGCIRRRDVVRIAGVFAFFQALMPLLGWVCVHTVVEIFSFFGTLVPWIALGLLGYIGGSMIFEGVKETREARAAAERTEGCRVCATGRLGWRALIVQGIATSIDALSVGFTIAEYTLPYALVAVLLIAAVTFAVCAMGVVIGRAFGTRLAGKATVLGGVILIAIGLEIFITGLFF